MTDLAGLELLAERFPQLILIERVVIAGVELVHVDVRASASVRLSGGILGPETLAAIERADLALSILGGSCRDKLEMGFIRARWSYLNGQVHEAASLVKDIYDERELLGHHTAGDVAILHGRVQDDLGRHGTARIIFEAARDDFEAAGLDNQVKEIDVVLENPLRATLI